MTVVTRLDYERAHGVAPQSSSSKLGAITLAELAASPISHDYLIKGLLTRNEVSLLVGPSGSGKSFLATDLSLRVARGIEYLPVHAAQRITVPRVKRGGVMYLAGEGARGLKKRLLAYLTRHQLDPIGIPFALLTQPIDLHGSDDHATALIDEIRTYDAQFRGEGAPVELVVIDTLSASTPGANENASEDMTRILGRCQRVAAETRVAVLLVHHMNASGQRERGHSSLRANVDSVIEVSRSDGIADAEGRAIRVARLTKQKDGEDGLHWRFVLRQIELRRDEDGDPITSCVVEAPAQDYQSSDGGFEFRGANARLIFDALLEALHDYGELPPQGLKGCPTSTAVVQIDHWKATYARRAPPKEDERKRADAVRKAMERALTDFQNYRIIGADSPYVWLTGRPVRGFNLARGGVRSDTQQYGDVTPSPGWQVSE